MRQRSRWIAGYIAPCLVFFFLSSFRSAQSQLRRVNLNELPPKPAVAGEPEVASPRVQVFVDPSLTSTNRAPVPTLSFTVFENADLKTIGVQAKVAGRDSLVEVTLAFSGPFDKANGRIDLANLSGLEGATKGELIVGGVAKGLRYAVGVEIGQEEFTYVDAGTLGVISRHRTPYSANLGFGGVFFGAFALHGGWRYARAYHPTDEATICSPIGPAGSLHCSEVTGYPSKDYSSIADLELRMLFKYNERPVLGLAPAAHYDSKDEVFGIELPVYFIPHEKEAGGLAGGVRFGFRQLHGDKWTLTLAAFVGNVFSLSPR